MGDSRRTTCRVLPHKMRPGSAIGNLWERTCCEAPFHARITVHQTTKSSCVHSNPPTHYLCTVTLSTANIYQLLELYFGYSSRRHSFATLKQSCVIPTKQHQASSKKKIQRGCFAFRSGFVGLFVSLPEVSIMRPALCLLQSRKSGS